jgi:hypothetical protein
METNDLATERHHHGPELTAVRVNDHQVEILGKSATGREIKVAAIEQGVAIELHFELLEHLPDGHERAIKDLERVELHQDMRFTARPGVHDIVISVNEQPVKMTGHSATGAQIKAAAIAQGVLIQPNFVLQEELPNGTSRIVKDTDPVHLREHLRFTAIAPDDNS